jgi:hypothetical protein
MGGFPTAFAPGKAKAVPSSTRMIELVLMAAKPPIS